MMKTVAKTTTKRASLEPSTLVAYTILPSIPTIGAMMKKPSLQVHRPQPTIQASTIPPSPAARCCLLQAHLIGRPMEGGAGRFTLLLPMKGRLVHLTLPQQVHLMSHQATTRRTCRQVQLMLRSTAGHLLMKKRNWKGAKSRGAWLFTARSLRPSLVRG